MFNLYKKKTKTKTKTEKGRFSFLFGSEYRVFELRMKSVTFCVYFHAKSFSVYFTLKMLLLDSLMTATKSQIKFRQKTSPTQSTDDAGYLIVLVVGLKQHGF